MRLYPMSGKILTQDRLKELLDYDDTTGVFTWKVRVAKCINIGDVAGNIEPRHGYIRINVDKKTYKAHRLAYFYVHGHWPKGQVDHINVCKTDNRIVNLRDVTHRENNSNKRTHREGKLVGAAFHKRDQKWQSCIRIDGKKKYLGYFLTQLEAHEAYMKALNSITC